MKLGSRLFTGIALLFIIGASSCTKDFICECELAYSGRPGLPDTLYNTYNLTNTPDEAKRICEEGSSESVDEGVKTVETCKLY